MEQWIRNNFEVIESRWENDDGTTEDAFKVNKNTIAPISFVVDNFGSASTPPTASDLKAVDPDDKLGWHKHFDSWKEQGKIPQ